MASYKVTKLIILFEILLYYSKTDLTKVQSNSNQMKTLFNILNEAGTSSSTQKDWGFLPYILTIVGNCLWPISWLYCNENKISFAQSTLARGIVSAGISYSICYNYGSENALKYEKNLKILITRSVMMTFHSFGTALGQFILPLPIIHTISCSSILFVFLIDYFMNGTKVNEKQIVGIVTGVIGVFVTSNGLLLENLLDINHGKKSTYQNYLVTDPYLITLFAIVYIIMMVGGAYGIVITRLAQANTFQINLIMGLTFYFGSALVLPFMKSLDYSFSTFIQLFKVIIFTGIPSFIVQILGISSLNMTKQTGMLSMMSFSMVIVSYLISIFRYNETPNLFSTIGILLVIFGVGKTVINKEQL